MQLDVLKSAPSCIAVEGTWDVAGYSRHDRKNITLTPRRNYALGDPALTCFLAVPMVVLLTYRKQLSEYQELCAVERARTLVANRKEHSDSFR